MRIKKYDVKDSENNDFIQLHDFMPERTFRLLLASPSGGGKTNLLLDMIYRLLYFDKIYVYARNLQQSKYKHLLKSFKPISKEAGYDVIEASNDEIMPLKDLSDENQKLVIFDDYLNTGKKDDERIRDYFTNSRNKNCSCIYLSQSYYGTDKTIRLNCSHFCVFEFPSRNEQSMICRELSVNKQDYQKATKDPDSFIYVDKVKKRWLEISMKESNLIIYEFL